MTAERLWVAERSHCNDLRKLGLVLLHHADYVDKITWIFTVVVKGINQCIEGSGANDMIALDKVRAKYAELTDTKHHAPACPANHYHGSRAPTGPCSCGAV